MKTIKHEYEKNGIEGVSVQTFVSFNNPHTLRALNLLFNVKDYEKLTGIEITEHGISAHIKLVK